MAKKLKKRTLSTATDYYWVDMIGDATLVAALYFVLPYSSLRLENFASDKAALLGALGPVIVGTWLLKLIQGWRPQWRTAAKHPVVIGVVLLLFFSLVSTIFSLTPSYSWAGKRIPNGTYIHIIYAILLTQTVLSISRVRKIILPTVVMLILMQFIWAFYTDSQINLPFIVSTAGNPNHLSAWLVMVIVFIVYELYYQFQRSKMDSNLSSSKQRNPKQERWTKSRLYMIFLGLSVVLGFGTMFYAGSRGALMALVLVLVGSILMIELAQKRFKSVLIIIAISIVAIIIFIFIAAAVPSIQDSLRVFRLTEPRRFGAWEGGVSVIEQMREPLPDYLGNPDSFSSIRPIIGYGPETVFQLQDRWGTMPPFVNEKWTSFHNHTLDTIVEKGLAGFSAWLIIFGGAFYVILKSLRWLSLRQIPLILVLLGIVCAIISIPLSYLADDFSFRVILPIAFGLAVPLTVYLWVFIQAILRYRADTPSLEIGEQQLFLIFGINIILAHWVDIQFAFAQPAAEPFFWFILGWVVYETLQPQPATDTEKNSKPLKQKEKAVGLWTTANGWLFSLVMTSICFIYIRNAIHFSPLYPSGFDLLIIVSAIISIGITGALLSQLPQERINWAFVAQGIVVGLVFIVIGDGINTYLQKETYANVFPQNINDALAIFLVTSLNGVVLFIISFIVYMLPWRNSFRKASWRSLGIVVICLIIGSAMYMADYSTSFASRLAWDYAQDNGAEYYEELDELLNITYKRTIFPQELYITSLFAHLHEVENMQQYTAENKQNILAAWQLVVNEMPFFTHSQNGWHFEEQYEQIFQESPTAE